MPQAQQPIHLLRGFRFNAQGLGILDQIVEEPGHLGAVVGAGAVVEADIVVVVAGAVPHGFSNPAKARALPVLTGVCNSGGRNTHNLEHTDPADCLAVYVLFGDADVRGAGLDGNFFAQNPAVRIGRQAAAFSERLASRCEGLFAVEHIQ